MSGAIAHFDVYDGQDIEENSPGTGRTFPKTCPTFILAIWVSLHLLASLFIPLFYMKTSSFHHGSQDVLEFGLAVFVDGIVLSAVVFKTFRENSIAMSILESSVATLRTSLRSATADVAAQGRYQLRAPAERDETVDQDQVSGAPSKMVAHAEPNWMSELSLEEGNSPNKLKGVQEIAEDPTMGEKEEKAGESSTTRTPSKREVDQSSASTRDFGLRPSWVENGTLCVVCHNPFGPEGAHILGTCGHAFHPPCLVDYCKIKRHCFCDVPIHARYYASVCLLENMPPESRDNHGRSTLHGDFVWSITIDS